MRLGDVGAAGGPPRPRRAGDRRAVPPSIDRRFRVRCLGRGRRPADRRTRRRSSPRSRAPRTGPASTASRSTRATPSGRDSCFAEAAILALGDTTTIGRDQDAWVSSSGRSRRRSRSRSSRICCPQIDYGDSIPGLIVVALIAGVVNGLIKPIIKLFSLPLTLMTFGLFGLVINAGLLLLIAWLSSLVGITFTVGGFPPDCRPRRDRRGGRSVAIAISIVGAHRRAWRSRTDAQPTTGGDTPARRRPLRHAGLRHRPRDPDAACADVARRVSRTRSSASTRSRRTTSRP